MKSIAAACMLNIHNCAEMRRMSTMRMPIYDKGGAKATTVGCLPVLP
jgi:hypothetical protein